MLATESHGALSGYIDPVKPSKRPSAVGCTEAPETVGVSNSIMKFLQRAKDGGLSLTSPRALGLAIISLLSALVPTQALAAEGENVHLTFSSTDKAWLIASLILGLVALAYGLGYLRSWVLGQSPGSAKMQEVGGAIRSGALAYLQQQIKTMSIFIVVLFVGLVSLYWSAGPAIAFGVGICFVAGVSASYIAGYSGMLMAVNGNMRTANAALTSYKRALEVAFRSGAVAGMVTVGVGLVGASLILLLAPQYATTLLVGFGFGGSLAALFMRVGGGIFTKAADVGADLVGKVEAGIPEDDPRNPATIADNVGDNVGDCAGMAADIFESYEVTLVAAIVLGAATSAIFDQTTWTKLIMFAMLARGVGILASIVGIQSVKGTDDLDADPLARIRKGFYSSAVIAAVLTAILAFVMMGGIGQPITTAQVTNSQSALFDEVKLVQSVRNRIAVADHKQPWEIAPKEILNDPVIKAEGFTANDEDTIRSYANAQLTTLPAPRPLGGYQLVTNPTDPKVPELQYATQNRSAAASPTNPFSTVGEVFGATGSDQPFIVKVHIQGKTAARPAQAGLPAQPAKDIDQTQYLGPAPLAQLQSEVKTNASQAKASGITTYEITDQIPMQLYLGQDGKLALVAGKPIDKPYLLGLIQVPNYFPESVDNVNKLIAQMRAGATTETPPTEQIPVGFLRHDPVPWWTFFLAIAFGIVMAFAIELLTDYYVSTHKKPVQEVAGVSSAGPAPMIIQGFAYASESSVFMVFSIVIALLFPLFLFPPAKFGYILSFYGIALVGLGLLTTTGYVLAMDTFGPISDNAQGVYEMSGEEHDNIAAAKAVQRLDAAGNTTKALTKGFAIATAVVAAVALFHSYLEGARLGDIGLRLDVPEIFLGLLIGGAAPYLFSAFAINAVGRSSFELINEVRRQFRADPGIMEGTSKPDYGRCVAIVTKAAQKELLGPGILAIALPVAVGFGFSIGKAPTEIAGHLYNLTGAEALGGFLAGAILSGQLLAVLLANSGGMWDNAKKLIEDGLYGGKGTEAHKAGVVCDTVGDPFKDTAGPALNPLIKVMNLVALLLAGVIIEPFNNIVLSIITIVALGLLAISIYYSKKGSMSTAMAEAKGAGAEAEAHFDSGAPAIESPAPKRRITVEDEPETVNEGKE